MGKIIDYKNLQYFYSYTSDGNMSLKYGVMDEVEKSQKEFFNTINIPVESTYRMDILYSDEVLMLHDVPTEHSLKCDAVISTKKDLYVFLAFGDCIPFVAYDDEKKVFAFAHLGWQSICKDLHLKVLKIMNSNYGCNLEEIKIFFGPSITKESYAFENPAQLTMPQWKEYIRYTDNLYHIDLVKYIVDNIKKLGVSHDNISLSNIDTATNPDFFSHYRSMHNPSEKEGRFIFGAGIKHY